MGGVALLGRSPSQHILLRLLASLIIALEFTAQVAPANMMGLPGGIESILGFVPKSTFKCEREGYFGDTENDCRIFHLCQKHVHLNSGRTVSLRSPLNGLNEI